jgi:hypothetical protein
MTNKLWISLSCAWLLLFCLSGCGPTRLVGGTETQNPEVVACVKKLAGAAFDAADTGNKWRPTSYLKDSSAGASLGKKARRAGDSSLVLSVVETAKRSDTTIMGDSIMIIYDTTFIKSIEKRFDTVIVDSTRFFIDTMTDTARFVVNGGSRVSISVWLAADSIIIKDTVIVTDTVDQRSLRVTKTVKRLQMENALPSIIDSTTTKRINLDTFSNKTSMDVLSGASTNSPAPSWELNGIVYSPINVPLSYRVVSVPTRDTMVVSPSMGALRIRTNDLFLSSKLFDNDFLVQTVTFKANDSLLSIGRFNPSALDTVESITTDYSVDIGADKFSGADDRLLGIERRFSYRLGAFHYCDVRLSPDQARASDAAKKIYSGMISMTIIKDDKTGVFSGVVDSNKRLIGVYEYDGKKYQVSCDSAYKTYIVEMAP